MMTTIGYHPAMSRPPRAAAGGLIYHAMNRAVARASIFDEPGDYDAFLRVLGEAADRQSMRVLAYCVMPNHFHLVLWPRRDGDLSAFMGWLTMTHTQRWHAQHRSAGTGHLYGGRYKSFPVQSDEHLIALIRYVERNPLRAGLVPRAELWPWGSLHKPPAPDAPPMTPWPVDRPRSWAARVNAALPPAAEEAVLRSIRRSQPLGDPAWQIRIATRLGILSTLRPIGRPKKTENGS